MNFDSRWVELTLSTLSLDEKIGQVLMCAQFDWDERTTETMKAGLTRWQPAGFFHQEGTPEAIHARLPGLVEATKVPPLVASDFEAGVGHMLRCGTRFPRPMARGHGGSSREEYEIGRITAEEGRALGTAMTFSPVIDLNTDPGNPDVNVRAYGEDLGTVVRRAVPHIRGLQEHGMLATVKHFPGNGDTSMDQHLTPALIRTPGGRFRKTFLEAYRQVFAKASPGAVMASYLTVPSLMSERDPHSGHLLPACLSKEALQGILRGELGFDGLIISDALNMGGGLCFHPRGEIAVKALVAGVDLLLCFSGVGDLEPEHRAIKNALLRKELTEERLNEAVRRVLEAKAKVGLDRQRTTLERELPRLKERVAPKTELCSRIVSRALTLLSNRDEVLPLGDLSGKKVLVLNTYSPGKAEFFKRGVPFPPDTIEQALRARGAEVESMELGEDSAPDSPGIAVGKAAAADQVFFNLFVVPSYAIGTLIPHRNAVRLFFNGLLTAGKRPPVITAFGDPYQRQYCHTAPVFLCTFDDTRESMENAVRAWFGESRVRGRCPVSLPGVFRRGEGLDLAGGGHERGRASGDAADTAP